MERQGKKGGGLRSSHLTRWTAHPTTASGADLLCFGDPVRKHKYRSGHVSYYFRPQQLFGIVWWRRHANDRQHRTLAVVEGLSSGETGYVLPEINSRVAVHILVRQHGPAGQDEVVDLLLGLVEDLKVRGCNPADLPASFWSGAAQDLLLSQEPLESLRLEKLICQG